MEKCATVVAPVAGFASEHGTWANANLCEFIQDFVDALFPLQTMSEGHEVRFVLSTCKRVSPFKRAASRLARDTGISHTSVSKTLSRRGGTRTREAVPSPWSNHLGCEGPNLARAHQPLLPSGFFRAG